MNLDRLSNTYSGSFFCGRDTENDVDINWSLEERSSSVSMNGLSVA